MATSINVTAAYMEQRRVETNGAEQEATRRQEAGLPNTRLAICVPGVPWQKLSRSEQTAIKQMMSCEGRQTFWDEGQYIPKKVKGSDVMVKSWTIIKAPLLNRIFSTTRA